MPGILVLVVVSVKTSVNAIILKWIKHLSGVIIVPNVYPAFTIVLKWQFNMEKAQAPRGGILILI